MRPKIGSHAANLNRETCSPGFVGEWEVRRLGDHVTFLRNGVNSRAELTLDDPVKYLHYGDIHSCTSVMLDPASLPSLPSGEAKNLDRLRDGDLVFADASEDLVGVSKSVEICSVSSTEIVSGLHTIAARFDKNTLADGFKAYLQFCPVFSGQLRRLAAGTKVYATNRSHIASVEMRLPGVKEQEAIVSVLSDTDALLDGLDWLIAKKRDLKQAAIQQLLTGETRLPGFEGEWTEKNMASDSDLKARIGWQGLTTAEYLESGNYKLVTGTDFTDGKIDWSNCCYVKRERYEQDRNIQLQIGDLLLTKDGTIGKVAYVDRLPASATLNSGVFVIRPINNSYNSLYFYYVLRSRIFTDFLTKLQAGSTINHLYQKDFQHFSFATPPLPEQEAIARALSDMDEEITALEQRRNKTKDIKQAMMQELLTGKTRLVMPGSSNV